MEKNKVKISNILDSQIPNFIKEDNPLFKEFLLQYFISEERKYGSIYLSENISSYKNISTYSDINFLLSPTILLNDITSFDDTIVVHSYIPNVNATIGFPNTYGLLKIDDEIITYTGITTNSFTGCIRGFSGVDKIESNNDPEFLSFNITNSGEHFSGARVENLSFIYLSKFYQKYKYLFIPGFENRNFKENLSVENILSRARDFYSSKGTDSALKILFSVLFGKDVEIIKPFDNTIVSSDSEWSVSYEMIVESIQGNPLNLKNSTILKDSVNSPTASGAVSNVEEIFLENKKYYKIYISKNTLNGNFEINNKTKIIEIGTTLSTVTVDSTVGFAPFGSFYYYDSINGYKEVTYQSKSYNQFFNCSGISTFITENSSIIQNNFIYGYEKNNKNNICIMRVVGSISNNLNRNESTKYFLPEDKIGLKYLGEKTPIEDKKFNKWFYNNVSYIDVFIVDPSTNTITTKDYHFLYQGDKIDIIQKSNNKTVYNNVIVSKIISETKFQVNSETLELNVDYIIKKRLKYISSNLNLGDLLSDVQNSFVDKDKNTYIIFSGYPSYPGLETTDRSKTFKSNEASSNIISIQNHNFLNGEKIYYNSLSNESGITGLSSGFYYVKKINNDELSLSLNRSNLFNDKIEKFNGKKEDGDDLHKIISSNLSFKNLKNQNNFKRIYKTPKNKETFSNIVGPIGVLLNGIELHSPISEDSVFYGQIEKINILNSGKDYDVINPPDILVDDNFGSSCEAYAHLSGGISEIILVSPGFDYISTPSVTISGGNGTGAECEAKMKSFKHSVSFSNNFVDLSSNTFSLNFDHKFLDGEEVIYTSDGLPIGIGSTNVGYSTSRLSNGGTYYIAKINNKKFSIATTKKRALEKTKLIDFTSFGNKTNIFTSTKFRKIIDRIIIKNPGNFYSNNKVVISSQLYPPQNVKDIFKTFVGINTYDNYIYAKNHNFNDGEIIKYSCEGTPIAGLSTSLYYKVTSIDKNKFKLSSVGTATSINDENYKNKVYVNIESIGIGTHIFNYPPIIVNITGPIGIASTEKPSYYESTAYATVKGKINNIFVKNGGIGYGVTNIINYIRRPIVTLKTGSNATIQSIINKIGEISEIFIVNSGENYTSPPSLEIIGSGNYAKLKANVFDGKIISVDILNRGNGYFQDNTYIKVIPTGIGAIFSADIYEWKINQVERYKTILNDEIYKNTLQIKSGIEEKENKICSFYCPKEIRKILNDNLDPNTFEDLDELQIHSPIIGWAYDGNPIYGPYGNAKGIPDEFGTGGLKRIVSSYSIDPLDDINLRPSAYVPGYFIDDYIYKNDGDLDEYNGRFIVNGDFPNGTYAYFSTLDSNKTPQFPYITYKHRNESDLFNYDKLKNQSDYYLNTGEYKRNITPLGLNEENRKYPFLSDSLNSKINLKIKDIKYSGISSIFVENSGENYNVGDKINFSNNFSIDCVVDEILGKNIISIDTTETILNDLVFSINDNRVTAFSTNPHNFFDGDIISITGISSAIYKNIEGVRVIGVNTISSLLSVSIGNTGDTGISTFVSLFEPTSSGNFLINDLIQIGSEKMLIVNIDNYNNRYRVIREYDQSVGSSHTQGKFVKKLPRQFTFDINKKIENKNITINNYYYFDAAKSVGIGYSYTNVIVGNSGNSNIRKSIPPRAIYLEKHNFKTGDILSLVSVGGTILASNDSSLTSSFNLSKFLNLYCVKLSDDYIGISTEKIGFTTSYVYFVSATGKNHKFENISNQISGSAKKINSIITLDSQHNLKKNDVIKLNIKPNKIQTFNFEYNNNIKKLIVDKVSFASTAVGVGSGFSTIKINNHGYETGDVVIYNSNDPIIPLKNNGIYYIIKISDDLLKIAENKYNSTKFPYEHIGITSYGSGSHQIAKINPRIKIYRGNTVSIAVSDSSLTDYRVNFYIDNKFKSKYESPLIQYKGNFGDGNSNTRILISNSESLPNLYYRIEGKNLNYTNTYPSSTNEEVSNYSQIEFLDSKLNGNHRVSGVGSTTITINLKEDVESLSYNLNGFSTCFYSSSSKTEKGGIHSVKIINPGKNINKLPSILSVGSTTGSFANLFVDSNDIGQILDVDVLSQGVEIPNDKTLTPKADTYTILRLKDIYTLSSIGIITGGKNYTSPPKTIAIGNNSILTKTSISGNSVSDVEIISNDSGISNNIRFIPTNNSNGVNIINATSSFQVNTIFLRAPVIGFSEFPFEIGDKIYVENVKIISNDDGYNSSDYNYQYFTVTSINTTPGTESVSYSISGIGSTGGVYDINYTFGRVIKANDLSSYSPSFKPVEFFEGEKISQINGSSYGYVAKNGWDKESNTLKLEKVKGKFEKNKKIIGSIGNNKSTIENFYEFDFDLIPNSLFLKSKTWLTDKGKLNLNEQRLQDNDYYQRFSYSIRGEVDYESWKEPIKSLTHISGFKNFSDYEILNGVGNTVIIKENDSQIDLTVEILGQASVYDKLYYDLASEDTSDQTLSKIIKFDSKVITDYNESRTNKVLLIDDISSQFSGVVTPIGGKVIGLTTFALYTSGDRLFHKNFDPAEINTSTSIITILNHNFNTGESLTYLPNDGSSIGIEYTYVSGIGFTTLLPKNVYAIKISNDSIKLAIGKIEAISGTAVSFTSVTGIGSTHSLSVETNLATSRVLISIDNILQSPISKKDISVSLISSVGIGSTIIYLNNISSIQGNSLIKIDDEILKVNLVGIGSTNALDVNRSYMGTVAVAHTIGAVVTILSGDYRIESGNIYFSDPPYGPPRINSLTTKSIFHGRAFYKLNYDKNYIFDDISENFNSSRKNFDLKSNGQILSGIQSNFGVVLVNNIFQRPFYGDVGSILESDYKVVGTGETITFTGTLENKDLPKGGIINEFTVGLGSGYQIPKRAYGYAVVSSAGTIQSIGISTSGSGYRFNPKVSIADTLGVGIGASIVSSISNGLVTSFSIVNPGSGYTNTNPPLVIIDDPSPYTNLPLSGGTGSNATMNVVVGTGGSVISFDIENSGYGYSIGDVLSLTGIPYQVGIGTSAFNITVKNRYQNKFSGWIFGQLLELDDFSNLFNGFRKTFLLTRTIVTKEYYSIVSQKNSGIILSNNLLIFINNVLQRPNIDYIFTSGTRLTFREAPKFQSKLKIYFYTGSLEDFVEVNTDQTIKPGDRLRLQEKNNIPSQEERIIYELIASDTIETQTYNGIGIVNDSSFLRPIAWSKQTSDIIIDGEPISKQREYLEPKIFPNTNIIASVDSTSSKIYVKNTYPIFKNIDDLSQTLNDIQIVGLGTTAVTEVIKKVSYSGDYGVIVGISTSATGIGTTSPMLIFNIKPNVNITNNVSRPGITTGDYFVIENSIIGNGVTSIKNNTSEIVSIGNSFIDNVYYANHIVSIGSSSLRVYSNILSLNGIDTSSLPLNLSNYGTYTWGIINCSRNSNSKSFEFYNQNGLLGIETSAYVSRLLQLKASY
jgi:hypothetical protein